MIHETGSLNGHALSANSGGVATKFQFQPQTHPPPPPPPLPQPTVSSLSPHSPSSSTPPSRSQPTQLDTNAVHLSYPPSLAPAVRIIQPVHSPNPPAGNHASNNTTSISPRSHAPMESRPRQSYSYNPQQYYQERYGQPSPDYPKPSTPLTPVSGAGSAYPPSSSGNDSDSDRVMPQEERSHSPMMSGDNDYESEDDRERYRAPRSPRASQREYLPSRTILPVVSLPPFSSLDQSKEDIVDRMRQEIANLRQSNADAVSTSLRLSEQLANANLEVSRSRGALRELEDRLQSEQSKRAEVERQLDMEKKRAEQTLKSLSLHSPTRSSSGRPT